jgi:hypothetical protein
MKRDVIEITRPLSLVSNYRDLLKLTISSYLIDDENIELGKKLVTNYYTHDKFKIDSISIDDNKLSDPNIVTIIFNKNLDELQNITQLIQYYGGDTYPADGTVNFDYSIVNNTLNISLLTVLDKSHQYYRMVIGDIISIDGDVLSQSGVEYEFITNHNIIFIGKNVVLSDETNSIVILS